mgnify:CR=1 FL=1
MNNRYRFRGKRKDNGEWIEGWITTQYKKGFDSKILFTRIKSNVFGGGEHLVDTETVGQCTGLKDKNGKLIFEGDIVESRASENQEDWKKWGVGFSDGSFCFNRKNPKKRKHKYEENLLCVDEIELYGLTVIGNIHDNPELLEVEE